MSDPAAPSGDLQFDRVEGAAPSRSCASCGEPIRNAYFEVNGQILCERCRYVVETEWNAGSGAARFGKALLFGLGAAAAGTLLYYAVLAITGYEIGLIAIAVGFMVGAGVRKGAAARGGWQYQALAVFLTYSSIVSSYVPLLVQEIRKHQAAVTTNAAPPGSPDDTLKLAREPGAVAPVVTDDTAATAVEATPSLNPVFALAMAIGFIYALPFFGGTENLLGLLIIGIGLLQAWRMNRKVELLITGPFKITHTE